MRIKNLDLVAAIVWALGNVAWIFVPGRPELVSIVLVLPLVLALPGYALSDILFHGRRSPRHSLVGPGDKIALSLGLSLGIDILLGFALNFSPLGIRTASWALSLGAVTSVLAMVALLLRLRDNNAPVLYHPRFRVTVPNIIVLLVALVVIFSAVWLSMVRPLDPQPSFTQLWTLPAKNNSCSVSIGVQSNETTQVAYRVEVTVNTTRTNNWSSIVLNPQQEWTRSITINPGNAKNLTVQVQLYRLDKPSTPYRSTHITFQVSTVVGNGKVQNQCKSGS